MFPKLSADNVTRLTVWLRIFAAQLISKPSKNSSSPTILLSCDFKGLIFDFYLNRKTNKCWLAAYSCRPIYIFNSPLNLTRTKRFISLMFSWNANLTILFPLPSTEKKTSTALNTQWDSFTSRKYKSNLIRTLIVVCEFVQHPVCNSLLRMISKGICLAMGTPVVLFLVAWTM